MRIRHPMLALALGALGAWVILGLFGKFVSPDHTFTIVVFLLVLFVALAATLTPLARLVSIKWIRSKWYHQHGLQHALRQGTLGALALVANLTLIALGAWFWADILLIGLAAVLVEMIALARK